MRGIIAAGAPAPPELRAMGINRIPLLQVEGQTLLARTAGALLAAGCDTVHVLAPEEVPLPDSPGLHRAPYSGALVSDLFRLLEAETMHCPLVIASGDMPLISAAGVRAVITAAAPGLELVYPVVLRETVEAALPGSRRTYLRVREGRITGGNVFWVDGAWLAGQRVRIEELFARRKQPLRLAALFGLPLLITVALGLASLPYLERRLGRIVAARLRAALVPDAGLAIDIDKPADVELVRSKLDPWKPHN